MSLHTEWRRAGSFVAITALLTVGCEQSNPLQPTDAGPRAVLAPLFSYAPTLWSAAGPGTVTLVSDGSGSDPAMTYALSGSSVFSTQTWRMSTTAASAGAVNLDYNYSGYHAFFQVRVFLRPFITHNGNTSYLSGVSQGPVNCCSAPSGGFTITGSTTFNVAAGDVYGWEFGGSNFDSDSRLLGTFKVLFPVIADATPPVIAAEVSGQLSFNGWYVSDVGVSWTVTDAESDVTSTTGGGPSTVTTDTPGASFTCSATSTGGSASQSVTVRRDVTAPVVQFAGNLGSYTVDQQVAITCSATDATSGVMLNTCANVSADAYTFGVGTHTLFASATDSAGIGGSGETQVTVQVTSGSLCAMVQRWVSQRGVANALCQQIRNGALGAFRNHVSAQSGKFVSAAHAALLIAWSNEL